MQETFSVEITLNQNSIIENLFLYFKLEFLLYIKCVHKIFDVKLMISGIVSSVLD